ncbi:hypothetical protein GCM10009657_37280 [Oryzihumus leptocrescens]
MRASSQIGQIDHSTTLFARFAKRWEAPRQTQVVRGSSPLVGSHIRRSAPCATTAPALKCAGAVTLRLLASTIGAIPDHEHRRRIVRVIELGLGEQAIQGEGRRLVNSTSTM